MVESTVASTSAQRYRYLKSEGDGEINTNEENDWRDNKTLLEQYEYMLNNQYLCDAFAILADGVKVQFHKLILARSSEFFKNLMYEDASDPLILCDVSEQHFKKILRYVYTDQITINSELEALELCKFARIFRMYSFSQVCVNYLLKNLTPDCACQAYELAVSMDDMKLISQSLNIIKEHTSKVLQSPKFTQIAPSTLCMLLQQEQLTIESELELIYATLKWAEKCSSLTFPREQIIFHLRFLSLSASQCAECIEKVPFLNYEEKLNILLNISAPGQFTTLSHLCSKAMPRTPPAVTSAEIHTVSCTNLDALNYVVNNSGTHCKFCSLTIRVNKSIYLHGCEIYTQTQNGSVLKERKIKNCKREGLRKKKRVYNEMLQILLMKVQIDFPYTSEILTIKNVNTSVNYGECVKVHFPNPIALDVTENFVYALLVKLKVKGCYPVKELHRSSNLGNVTFDFKSSMPHMYYRGAGGIVSSLCFSTQESIFNV